MSQECVYMCGRTSKHLVAGMPVCLECVERATYDVERELFDHYFDQIDEAVEEVESTESEF